MKSDTAIKEFLEKYDEEAINYIESFSNRFAANANKKKYKLFNIKECFDNFTNYLRGYGKYKVDNINNPKATSQDIIIEKTGEFIESTLRNKDTEVLYNEIPNFVKSYTEGIKSLNETVDEIKTFMSKNDVDVEAIGNINEFVDKFMDLITESFDKKMDDLLWSSGYMSNKILLEKKDDPRKKDKPVFL